MQIRKLPTDREVCEDILVCIVSVCTHCIIFHGVQRIVDRRYYTIVFLQTLSSPSHADNLVDKQSLCELRAFLASQASCSVPSSVLLFRPFYFIVYVPRKAHFFFTKKNLFPSTGNNNERVVNVFLRRYK